MLQRLVVEAWLLDVGQEGLERSELQQALDVLEGLETNKGLEIAESQGNLGLVVGVCKLVGLLFVELGGEFLVLGTLARDGVTA
jgi:hypothetical protein